MKEFNVGIIVRDNVTGIVVSNYDFTLNARTQWIAEDICMHNVKKNMLAWRRGRMMERHHLTAEQTDAIIEEYHIDLLSDYTFEIQ